MTTTTVRRAAERRMATRGCAGFTLAELLVATTLSSLVLAAVLTSFLFFSRAGLRLAHYSDMERQSRMVLQRFGQDAREARAVAWPNATTLRLTNDGGDITYSYDSTGRRLTRTPASGSAQVVASDITDFRFLAYDVSGAAVALSAGDAAAKTKMVQVDIDLTRRTASAANATAQVVSARYVLRNKGAL